MSVLGLDVGTSTCKGVVLSEDGRILAQNQITYADAVTVRGATAEISANVFEDSAKKVISVLAQATKHDPIAAIAVSSHGETLIPIGRNGRPLCDAILSMDRRSQDCSDHLIERFGQEKIYSIKIGVSPSPWLTSLVCHSRTAQSEGALTVIWTSNPFFS